MERVLRSSGALSPTGTIRPFDRRADGILIGEGTGIVVLKRLADAERDGDRIYAVDPRAPAWPATAGPPG